MHAAKGLEISRVETLHAQRQALDASRLESGEPRLLECARIGLQRDFRVGREGNACAHPGENAIDRVRRKKARRTAPKKHPEDAAAPNRRQGKLEIGDQCIDVLSFGQSFTPLVRIEIAIRTLLEAPRNMYVQRERRQRRKARAA